MRRWFDIDISKATISVEKPTPTIPPVLHRPWNDPFILRSNSFCSAIAWVFIDTFRMRILKAKTQRQAIKAKLVVAKPIPSSESDIEVNANSIGIRLSNRATSHPEMGKPIRELVGINNKMVPNSASL